MKLIACSIHAHNHDGLTCGRHSHTVRGKNLGNSWKKKKKRLYNMDGKKVLHFVPSGEYWLVILGYLSWNLGDLVAHMWRVLPYAP